MPAAMGGGVEVGAGEGKPNEINGDTGVLSSFCVSDKVN